MVPISMNKNYRDRLQWNAAVFINVHTNEKPIWHWLAERWGSWLIVKETDPMTLIWSCRFFSCRSAQEKWGPQAGYQVWRSWSQLRNVAALVHKDKENKSLQGTQIDERCRGHWQSRAEVLICWVSFTHGHNSLEKCPSAAQEITTPSSKSYSKI